MPALALRRRLSWIEVPLLVALFALFYVIAGSKETGYAAGVLVGASALALAFFRPRWGLIAVLALLFTESVLNVLNSLADAAQENGLSGIPYLVQTQWFAWGVLIVLVVLLLSYYCGQHLKGERIRPLIGIEWALLLPLVMALFYLPISMINGYTVMHYTMDILPMCIYAGIVVLARALSTEPDLKETRYFFLDWFNIFNILILIPLWAYNFLFDPWRAGLVAVAAIRVGTGPYDFNFFLVPLLGMILTYDEHLTKRRRRLYQFSFFLGLVRIVVSLFRGAMGGTLLALIIASFLVDAARRRKWIRSLLIFAGSMTVMMALLVVLVPPARAVFNVALVRRIKLALSAGTTEGSLEFRQLEGRAALEDIMREPIIGYGPGVMIVKNFDPEKFARVELYLHSGYLWFWYKMGILGLATVVAFFAGIYATCIGLLRRSLHPPDRGWVIGTLAATIAMLPVIQTNNMLIRSQGAYALMLLLFGLCLISLTYRDIPRDQLPPADGEVAR